MNQIDERKLQMESFMRKVEQARRAEEILRESRNTTAQKIAAINREKINAKENCANALFAKLYSNALPLKQEYKNAYMKDLGDAIVIFIKKRCPEGTMAYLDNARKQSVPARCMCEAVNSFVDKYFAKFFENIEETDVDDIKMDVEDPDVKEGLESISLDLNHDDIAEIVRTNVENTIRDEREQVRAEDSALAELQKKLEDDDDIKTESAIDMAVAVAHVNTDVKRPSLFNGIMIGNVTMFSESAPELDEVACQKKSFFESVKEYTKWEMISALMLESFDKYELLNIADKYARNKI